MIFKPAMAAQSANCAVEVLRCMEEPDDAQAHRLIMGDVQEFGCARVAVQNAPIGQAPDNHGQGHGLQQPVQSVQAGFQDVGGLFAGVDVNEA